MLAPQSVGAGIATLPDGRERVRDELWPSRASASRSTTIWSSSFETRPGIASIIWRSRQFNCLTRHSARAGQGSFDERGFGA